MALQVIVDGYNLLGVLARGLSGHFMSEEARESLIRALSAYHQRKGHAVTVVFDGWRDGLGAEHREHRSGVDVVYSRRGERADQVIQRLARQFGRDCAVVSSDGEVATTARSAGAFVLRAQEFSSKLRASSSASGPGPWKKDGDGDDRPSRRPPDKKGNPRKLPKSLRLRRRMLKGF